MSVIIPGSYDPVTLGHLDVIRRTAASEDEVYAVVFINPEKNYRFSVEDRVRMLMLATEGLDNVFVSYSLGRVVDYMREHGIEKIVKGYRDERDLAWEKEQAEYNMKHGGYKTELLLCRAGFEGISSTLVREKIDKGEDLTELLPASIIEYIMNIKAKTE